MAIARSEVLKRSGEGWPKNGVPYNQGKLWADAGGTDDDGWRQDCSGYVSMCLGLPRSAPGSWGGYSTETLATHDLIFQLGSTLELLPGDLIGRCGPGTAGGGGGHVALYIGPPNPKTASFLVRDHGGSGDALGWDERTVKLGSYRAWRSVGVDGAVAPGLGYRELKAGDYGLDVKALQVSLNVAGAAPKLAEDKDFGPITTGAVQAFQRKYGLVVDGIAGPKTIGKLLEVTAPIPTPPPLPPAEDLAAQLVAVRAELVVVTADRDRLAGKVSAAAAALAE